MDKIEFIFINGRGSSGKDTQANLLVENDPFSVRISTGDIFRGGTTPKSEYGRFYHQLAPYIELVNAGGFLPDQVIIPIVSEVIKELALQGKSRFIFTGFPRTVGQLENVKEWLAQLKSTALVEAHFICLGVSEERSKKLAFFRRQEAVRLGLPIRPDDVEDILVRRLAQYREKVEPMLKSILNDPEYPLIIVRGDRPIPEVHDCFRRQIEL